jgi:hypothetical protein
MEIHRYIKDRDEAMLAYPDTSKLEALYIKYDNIFPPEFKRRWSKASDLVKVMTLEKMILCWAGAPDELVAKVKRAQEERS